MPSSGHPSCKIPPPHKKLGQHYLISHPILQRIVQAAQLTQHEQVVEIGPGTGKLTLLLAKAAKQVLAIEIDPRLCQFLAHTLKEKSNIVIIQADAATYDYQQLVKQYLQEGSPRFKLVANVPYYLSTPLLLSLIKHRILFQLMVLMLQAEFAQRLAAKPGTKAYSSLTITLQYYMDIDYVLPVPAQYFTPRPKVDSAVLRLTPLAQPRVKVADEQLLFSLIRAAFAQRRKTLYNALIRAASLNFPPTMLKEALDNAGINATVRGEMISLAGFAKLANSISKLHQHKTKTTKKIVIGHLR